MDDAVCPRAWPLLPTRQPPPPAAMLTCSCVCVYLRPCSCCLRQRWQHHYLSHLDDIKARRAARGGVAHLRKHHRHQHHHHHHTRRGSHAGAQADGHDSSSSSDDEDGDDEAYSKLAILTANSQYLPRLCVPARLSVCHPAVSVWLRAPVLHLHLSAMWRASGTTHTAPVDPTPTPTPAPHPHQLSAATSACTARARCSSSARTGSWRRCGRSPWPTARRRTRTL